MATGVSLPLVVPPGIAEHLEIAALEDGVTTSQAASLALALGAPLPAHARRLMRLILEKGGDEATSDLVRRVTHAIAVVGNSVVECRLLDHTEHAGADLPGVTEEQDAADAVELVRQARRHEGHPGDPV